MLRSEGLDTILVVVDHLTKYSHFIPLSHPFIAKDVVEVFIKEVVRLHRFSQTKVTDRDRLFMSQFWTALFKAVWTKLKYTTAYHPQIDGLTEVVNRCLNTYLRCFAGLRPKT